MTEYCPNPTCIGSPICKNKHKQPQLQNICKYSFKCSIKNCEDIHIEMNETYYYEEYGQVVTYCSKLSCYGWPYCVNSHFPKTKRRYGIIGICKNNLRCNNYGCYYAHINRNL